jgi:hypothetical protein
MLIIPCVELGVPVLFDCCMSKMLMSESVHQCMKKKKGGGGLV